MVQKILTSSRYVILIAVVGSFLAALTALIVGGIKTVQVIIHSFEMGFTEKITKVVSISFIEVIDLFLIGTVFYITALGLYELFIDDNLTLPGWLVVRNLDDLKGKLINGVVVIMAVFFLGTLVNWDGQSNLLQLGGSVALMIAALTAFQFVRHKGGEH